jgi:hypothetical protein
VKATHSPDRVRAQVGPALPLQLAGRMVASLESQAELAAAHRIVVARHRQRLNVVTDINEAIEKLRSGHIVECASALLSSQFTGAWCTTWWLIMSALQSAPGASLWTFVASKRLQLDGTE